MIPRSRILNLLLLCLAGVSHAWAPSSSLRSAVAGRRTRSPVHGGEASFSSTAGDRPRSIITTRLFATASNDSPKRTRIDYTKLSSTRSSQADAVAVSTTPTDIAAPSRDEFQRGLLTIGFITLLFASNSPVLHVALASDSVTAAPPVLLINAAVSVVALSGLVFGGGSLLESSTPLPGSLLAQQQQSTMSKVGPWSLEQIAGLELGTWKMLGTTANLYGLSLTSADHGAFLIQLTTLIVPMVQGLMGVPIPQRVQFAVALALGGVFLFTQDSASATAAGQGQALGDALCVLAAGFYSAYDLRLYQWGKKIKPKNLITNKIGVQAVLSVLLLLGLGWNETMDFVSQVDPNDLTLLLPVVLWSGIAVNAVAPFLQVGGQQAVGPTRAQTLYASQPLWAAILSYAWLGETVGTQGLIGGMAFLGALGLAATTKPEGQD